VDESTPLIIFCLTFYRLYLKTYGLDMTEPSETASRDAARARGRLEREKSSQAEIQLIGWFEEFCERYPDLTELVSPAEFDEEESTAVRDFYEGYMPIFLDRILAWAEEGESEELVGKIEEVRDAYGTAIDGS
jgi:hypothetical protein